MAVSLLRLKFPFSLAEGEREVLLEDCDGWVLEIIPQALPAVAAEGHRAKGTASTVTHCRAAPVPHAPAVERLHRRRAGRERRLRPCWIH